MKILITGVLGYVGSFLTEALFKERPDIELFGIDNFSNVRSAQVPTGVHFTKLDLSNFQETQKYFSNHTFDVVVHLAGLVYVHDSFLDTELYKLHNLRATENMLKICRLQNINKIIFASSSTLYQAPNDYRQLTEESILKPLNPYGQTKLDCEELILKNDGYFKGYIFRFFNIAGAALSGDRGQDSVQPKHVIDRMSAQQVSGASHANIFGQNLATPDGTVVRDFIHVLDVTRLIVKAIQKIDIENSVQIFNCGSGKGTSLKELVSAFSEIVKKNIQIQWREYHQGDPLYLVGDSRRAQSYFDWRPEHSDISVIIQSTYQWSLKRTKY